MSSSDDQWNIWLKSVRESLGTNYLQGMDLTIVMKLDDETTKGIGFGDVSFDGAGTPHVVATVNVESLKELGIRVSIDVPEDGFTRIVLEKEKTIE